MSQYYISSRVMENCRKKSPSSGEKLFFSNLRRQMWEPKYRLSLVYLNMKYHSILTFASSNELSDYKCDRNISRVTQTLGFSFWCNSKANPIWISCCTITSYVDEEQESKHFEKRDLLTLTSTLPCIRKAVNLLFICNSSSPLIQQICKVLEVPCP